MQHGIPLEIRKIRKYKKHKEFRVDGIRGHSTWDRGPACGQSEGGKYSYLGSRHGGQSELKDIPACDQSLACVQSEGGKYSYLGLRSGLCPI
jgi:hypothetical protein